ncbi:MAG: hypothetical protein ACK5TX_10525, partial [Planctomyces sp.]
TRIFTDHRKGDVGAISPFNFLQSTLYGRDAIATDEHGFSRIKTEGSDAGPHAKTRRREDAKEKHRSTLSRCFAALHKP